MGYGQKLVQSFKVTYDENLSPILAVKLQNKLKKEVAQVEYLFQFADMKGWENTSVARALVIRSQSTIKRTINLKVGTSSSDTFKIPLPVENSQNEPSIRILRVRYSDGTIDNTVIQ